jgi:hypothetical protein
MIASVTFTLPVAAFPGGPAVVGWLLLATAVVWSLRPAPPEDERWFLRWGWWLMLAAVLLAFRWPLIWLPHELYPDESQLLCGALTLRHDPVFWRSVDGGTAGPLDYYALLPAAFCPGVTAFAATRITAALLIWAGLVATGETLALVSGRQVARIAVLPVLAFAAFTTSPEFVHCSTELVPAALLAAAVFGLVRQGLRPSTPRVWLTALLLGAVPFAKLQAAPIALLLGLVLVVQEFRAGRRANVTTAIVAALLPTLAALTLVTLTDQRENMMIPYFLQNLFYSSGGRQPLAVVLREHWEQAVTNGYLPLWLTGSTVAVVAGLMRTPCSPRPLRRVGLIALAQVAAAIACVLAPGRPYQHYVNLMVMPLGLLAGLALAVVSAVLALRPAPRQRAAAVTFLLFTLAPQVALALSGRADPYAYYNNVATAPGPAHLELVRHVRALAAPGESLGLWGWRSALYVETGLHQATREAHTEFLFVTGPWQQYYLRRYFGDLLAAPPPVFADAVGPGNFRFTDRRWAHEVFPRLRDWLAANYVLAGEWDGVRVYVRRDRRPAGVN